MSDEEFVKSWSHFLITEVGYEEAFFIVSEGIEILNEDPVLDVKALERMLAVQKYLKENYKHLVN